MNCRTCNQTIDFNLTESDFLTEHGEQLVAVAKTIACPSCQTMNTRYFSWEVEFGEETPRLFAAVPTAWGDLDSGG